MAFSPSGYHSRATLAQAPSLLGVLPLQGLFEARDGISNFYTGAPPLLGFLPSDLDFIFGPGDPEDIDYLWDQTRLSPTVGTPLWDTH
jgi:hypothetical protein